MKKDVKAPSVGESVTEVRIGKWLKQNGEAVKTGELICEIESDKATVEVIAESNGVLQVEQAVGATVKIGERIATIDDAISASVSASTTVSAAPAATLTTNTPAMASVAGTSPEVMPAARKMALDAGVDVTKISGTGKDARVTKGDVIDYQDGKNKPSGVGATVAGPSTYTVPASATNSGRERRVPMTLLRQKIAERLVYAQHTAAILTTFNECDMSAVMQVRNQHKDAFKAKHGVSLGFMSFFTRAVVEALKAVPAVNAQIDGKDMIYRDYYDVGVAVGTERGLVVPVVRDVGAMGIVDIEKGINALALKARDGKLSIQDLQGGTFTISNGGVYGSLLSTPILNPPQSGILGMHKIQERPVVINGKVEVRPMMYLALSYDHRIIDGKEAVTFLIKVKEAIENPQSLGLDF